VDEEQPSERAGAPPRAHVGVLRLAHAGLQDAVRSQRHAEQAPARHRLGLHLAAAVAHEHDRAVLLEEARHALVVAHAAIHQAHAAIRVEAVQHERLEQPRHAGGRRDGVAEADPPVPHRRVLVVHWTISGSETVT